MALVLNPTVPTAAYANEERIRRGLPKRKLYHNCSGKHLALMLLQRELGQEVTDYWKPEAAAQKMVEDTICKISGAQKLTVGFDGCGVPVFACAMKNIAVSYRNLACPDGIPDEKLRATVAGYIPRIHAYPLMMRGTGYLCSLINYDPNLVGKGGANGVYGFGLRRERLGVSFKLADGTEDSWPLMVLKILSRLGCLSEETKERLEGLSPNVIWNDNELVVGRRELCF